MVKTSKKSVEAINKIWIEYKQRPTKELRDKLIINYAPMLKFVGSRVAAGLPKSVSQEDLIGYGMFGLIDAIEKFQPELGYKFETYAVMRVRGAIIDELRAVDWVPRTVRAKSKEIEAAISKLESEHKRTPTDQEIAAELDWTMDQYDKVISKVSFIGVVALEASAGSEDDGTATVKDTLTSNEREYDPEFSIEGEEKKSLLLEAMKDMSDREKLVITLYYYENMTLADIGQVLGVTESRVCQIHTRAILTLRSKIAHDDLIFALQQA